MQLNTMRSRSEVQNVRASMFFRIPGTDRNLILSNMITVQIFFPGTVWTRFDVVRLIRPPEAEKVGETSKK